MSGDINMMITIIQRKGVRRQTHKMPISDAPQSGQSTLDFPSHQQCGTSTLSSFVLFLYEATCYALVLHEIIQY